MRKIAAKITKLVDARCVSVQTRKVKDHDLETPEFRAWRNLVLKRAGYRCEWVEVGQRCRKSAPHHRMVADHIQERADGGALYDPANGQCLCIRHNTIKGIDARRRRLGM